MASFMVSRRERTLASVRLETAPIGRLAFPGKALLQRQLTGLAARPRFTRLLD